MKITNSIVIPESEIIEKFIKGSGPGGQNVNKVATAVQLRFSVRDTNAIPAHIKSRIFHIYGNRINKNGELIVEMSRARTQAENRKKAREVFESIIRRSLRTPNKRVKTKPTYRARQSRLDRKKKHALKKALRSRVDYN